jgi:hypothetical protein
MAVQIYTLHSVQVQHVKIVFDLSTLHREGNKTMCFIPGLFFFQSNMVHICGYLLEPNVYLINKNGVTVQIPCATIDVDALYLIYNNTFMSPVSDTTIDWCPVPYRPDS